MLAGTEAVWRCPPDAVPQDVPAAVAPGDALVIPIGWAFQFRADVDADLRYDAAVAGYGRADPMPEGGLGKPTLPPADRR